MGGMKIRKHITYKIITALLFPPAIFLIQFKSAKELKYMPQTQEEHEQELESQEDLTFSNQEPNPNIGLTLNGLKARNERASLNSQDSQDLVEKVLVIF